MEDDRQHESKSVTPNPPGDGTTKGVAPSTPAAPPASPSAPPFLIRRIG